MLLSKKISDTIRRKQTRKVLEKHMQQFLGQKESTPLKISKDITSLFLHTAKIIDHFSVAQLWPADTSSQINQTIQRAINTKNTKFLDPLDEALHAYTLIHPGVSSKHGPVATLPFEQTHAMSGNIWHHGSTYELAVKGAPEDIIAKCSLTENEREVAERKLHQLAGNGGKVVALAHGSFKRKINSFTDLKTNDELTFDGLVSLSQHISPRVKKIVKAAQDAGVTVYLMTGDHPESALHIAKELGIATHKGHMFDSRRTHITSSDDLKEITNEVSVFSRTNSQNKNHITAHFEDNKTLYLM